MRPFRDYPAPAPTMRSALPDIDYLMHVLTRRVVVPLVTPFVLGWFVVGIFMGMMR